ncbi:MAG: endonuclease III domain-containing protein [Negativicutes bacterium]|nr:endonuclease III domain-containing protein [Negativicutes bacterium]
MTDLARLFDALLKAYGPRNWWPAQTPFEMMVGAVLTQNTSWKNVEKAIANFGDRLTPAFIAEALPEEIACIIRPSGYYNQKAIKLKALTAWYQRYGCDIGKARQANGEQLRGELLAVKGIGPETADAILLYALYKPFFVVDAYTRRILHRLGYEVPQAYESVRGMFEANLPRDVYLYNEFHALLVEHAKRHCQKQPACGRCPLEAVCLERNLKEW